MFNILFNSIIIALSGAMMPGSLLTYTMDKSIKTGAKAGFLIIFGHALLEFVIVVLLMTGVGSFLATDMAQIIIGFAGGLVMLYLGAGMIRDALLKKLIIAVAEPNGGTEAEVSGQQAKAIGFAGPKVAMMFGGALISASNPYFIFWWAAVGLGFIISAYRSFGIPGVIVFYLGHIFTDISWYGFVSFLISRTRRFINIKIYTYVIAVLGIFIIIFGAGFIINSIKLLMK